MIRPVKQQRLYEKVTDQIQELIAAGELAAGDRLPNERTLAEQFGVSRTVIREALKALAVRGLVEVRPGQGTFVVDATSDSLSRALQSMLFLDQSDDPFEGLLEVREILEPEIAYRAAQRVKPEDVEALRRAVEAMDANLHDRAAFIRADDAFHLALAVATQNAFVPRLLESVVDVLHEHRSRIFDTPGGPARGQVHHKRILRAVEDGAPEAAREAMRGHLAQIRQDSEEGIRRLGHGQDAAPAREHGADAGAPRERRQVTRAPRERREPAGGEGMED